MIPIWLIFCERVINVIVSEYGIWLAYQLTHSWLLRYIVIIVAVASNDTVDFNHQPNHCWCYCSILVVFGLLYPNSIHMGLSENTAPRNFFWSSFSGIFFFAIYWVMMSLINPTSLVTSSSPSSCGRPGPPASFPCTGDRLWPRSSTLDPEVWVKSDEICETPSLILQGLI